MRILFVGPPLYGLLYPVLSLAQAFRVNGHEVLIASGGKFAQKAAEAGLVVFDAAPGFDSEAGYRRQEALRKENNIGTKMGNFSFFSEEMTDPLVAFAGQWRPDLIVYPPLGVVGPLIAAKYDIPVVMQTVGFGHTPRHIKGVTKSLSDAYRRHGVSAPPRDLAWIDVTPPSMSILQNDGEPVISMQYVPYNGGAVWEEWWERTPDRKRLLVSLGTVKPMVDGLDLISWVMDSAGEVDAEIILHLPANARSDLRLSLIHISGADRPVNARAVVERGCGIIPGKSGLTSSMINTFLGNHALREASQEVAAEMAAQPCPTEVAKKLIAMLQHG